MIQVIFFTVTKVLNWAGHTTAVTRGFVHVRFDFE